MAAGGITHITNRDEHDVAVAQSETTPTVIYLSNSATPVCKAFTKGFERTAESHASSGIQFCQLEFNNETSMLFKFAPNQLPVVAFMCRGPWCRSVVGATQKDLDAGIKQLLEADGAA
ncbi:hypothetical protein LTR53_010312 [Teratosphaeriaceae sp. CCFEE 6253]|nr:hypothetical protein LTR53_010312 [Teratosphaeriaceae sp. CCFEE 6253]